MIIKTDKTNFTLELHGKEQILAVKAKVVVPKKTITKIEWQETFKDWRKWEVRLPGAGIPGRVIAGSFWTEEGWDFLYLTQPHGMVNPFVHNVLCIKTNQNKFSRIILSCDKVEAQIIITWFKKK